jgi:hypothetical protein
VSRAAIAVLTERVARIGVMNDPFAARRSQSQTTISPSPEVHEGGLA